MLVFYYVSNASWQRVRSQEKFKTMFMELLKSEKKSDEYLEDGLFIGQLGDLTDVNWNKIIAEFFIR